MLGLQQIRSQFLSPSVSYYIDRTILLVPPPNPFGSLMKLLLAFSFDAWILLIVILAIVFVLVLLIMKAFLKARDIVIGINVETPALNILAILLGIPLNNLPRRNFARFLLIMFTMFCFIVRSGFYQGKLFGILKTEMYPKEISTIDEYQNLNYEFFMYEGLATRFTDFKFYKK